MSQAADRRAALAAVNLAAVIFGSVALFGAVGVSPLWLVAGRSAIAAAPLLVALAIRGAPFWPGRQAPAVAATGSILAVHWLAFFASVQTGGVAVATVTVAAFPLFAILLDAVRLRRRPSAAEIAAGAAIVAAVALIARPDRAGGAATLLGASLGLAAAALFAVFSLISRPLVGRFGALRLSAWQYAACALTLAPFLSLSPAPHAAEQWLALAILGLAGTALAHQLYLFALARMPAAACGAFVSLEPVYAIVLAALLLGQPLRASAFAAAAIIVGASWLLLRRPEPG